MLFRIILFATFTLGVIKPVAALHFHVNPTTGDDRRSVQSAQDTSTAFKTITHALRIAHLVAEGRPHVIELSSGTYSPSTGETFPLNIAQTGIYIKTNGQTIFDAEGKSNFFNITAPTSNFTIKGIDFLNGQADKGGVAYCNTCSLRVVDNRFFKNKSTQGGHIVYSEKGHLKFYKNIVRDSGNGADTLAVIELRNTFTDTTVRDEIRNNTFYRNPSPNIWTSSPRTYISSNIFIDPQRAVIRDASATSAPLIDHNLFWQAEILYVSDKGDSVNINRAVRDTLSFTKAGISLPSFMTSTPDVRTLRFRGDTLSLADLNVRIPSFVTNHPDTLVQVGQAHQYLIEVSGTASQYQFKSLTLPTNARLDSVSNVPRLLIWNTTLNDTASHPISLQITAPSGQIDTLSYNLDVLTAQNFPDTTGFLAVRDSSGRFAGMVKEVTTIEAPHKANENYRFDIQVQGGKTGYFFTPFSLPSGVSSSQVTSEGIIDWNPTLADTGRSNVSVEIIDPVGNIDTLTYNIFVFKPEVFPDTSLSAPIITTTLIPDTTAAVTALNALAPSFSVAASATGNIYANPVVLDTTVNRFELITGSSPAINTGTPVISLKNAVGNNRNDIGNFGGPNNGGPPAPDTTSFSEVKITTLPDSVVTEGQVFTYNPVLSPNANIDLVDLIQNVSGSSVPPTMNPFTTFGQLPPITWTPTLADTGSYLIGVRVITASSNGRHYFPLRVRALNEIPVLTATADTTANEDELYSYAIQASDANGDTLSYTLVTGPTGMTVNSATGLVQWTPDQSNVGSHAISIRIDDGKNGINLHNYTLVVSNTNDVPVITSTPDTTASEDALFRYAVLASDPDPADTLSYALTTAPTGATIDSLGVIRWTPTQAQVGPQQFAVKISDRNGGTITQNFAVQVAAVDDAPVIAATADTSATEDSAYTLNLQASDEEGGTLSYALSQGPAGMTIDSTGTLRWTPTNADVGTHAIVATATDPAGQTASLSFSLVVTAVNDAPSILAQRPKEALVRNTLGNAVALSIAASDEEGDALSYSWLVNGNIQVGAVDTAFTYTPTVAQLDSVVVRIADSSDTTRFTWRVDSRQIPRISLDATSIDFSNVAIGDTARAEVTVSNGGETDLSISSLQVNDLHFAAVFAAISIAPNQSTSLALSYTPSARGASTDTIRFSSNDPDNATLAIPVAGVGAVATTLSLDLNNATGDQTSVQKSIQAGDSVSVAIYAQKTAALQSYKIRLVFDPSVLSFSTFAAQSSSETNLLAAQGASVVVTSAVTADSVAILDAAISSTGITGSGLLGVATFKADSSAANGATNISLQRALLKSQGVSASDTLGVGLSTTINIRPALLGDFDLDGDVDFNDFFIFADNFGRTDFAPATDLNTDGAVTFDDFFIFADNFGATAVAKLIAGEGAQTAPLRLALIDSRPDQVSLTPYWQGETAARGYVLSLSFDPAVLHFKQYVPRAGEAPLPWIVESTPGQLTLATGLARGQADFSGEDLGEFTFSRLAPHGTQIRSTAALSFDGQSVKTLLPPPALDLETLPQTYALYPAHPNPFNPETTIPFYLPAAGRLSLTVYDLLGRPVRTLVDGPMRAGYHSLTWRGNDDDGRTVGSGLYLIEMRASQWRQIRKIMLLK